MARMNILLSLGGLVVWTVAPANAQNFVRRREIQIPATSGAPAFVLQVSAEGRRGMVSVRNEKGTELQNLTCPLLRAERDPTATQLAGVRVQFVTRFAAEDLDSDGHPDLMGVREFGAKWGRYCVWLYDPKQHLFATDFLAEQIELLVDPQPLPDGAISSSHMGPDNPSLAIYRIAGASGSQPDRQLVPISTCVVKTAKGAPATIVITRYQAGRAVVHRQEASKLDPRKAMDECEALTQPDAPANSQGSR